MKKEPAKEAENNYIQLLVTVYHVQFIIGRIQGFKSEFNAPSCLKRCSTLTLKLKTPERPWKLLSLQAMNQDFVSNLILVL